MLISCKKAIPAFVVAVLFSLAGTLIAVYATKRAPLEAYEPYFQAEISESTEEAMEAAKYIN